ncbi:MAG: hypothetical protein GYA24_18940 [Candidatus Lokiarchaeota archaeon]|nr:hypothetical protein [Candidatus Lokiarchaeota archaeon]
MKDHKILADAPDLLIIAQTHTKNKSIAAPPVISGVVVSIYLIYFNFIPIWLAIVIPAAVVSTILVLGFYLFQGTDAIKIDTATRSITILGRKWLPPFERVEYLVPFEQVLHAGIYPYTEGKKKRHFSGWKQGKASSSSSCGQAMPGSKYLPG